MADKQETTANRGIMLEPYDTVMRKASKLSDSFNDQNVVRKVQALLKEVNVFCEKHKCQVQYRLALPKTSDDESMVNAGIEIGKVQMPKTLQSYLMSKCKEDKPTKNRLFAMLLRHQKFPVAIVKNRIRIKLQ